MNDKQGAEVSGIIAGCGECVTDAEMRAGVSEDVCEARREPLRRSNEIGEGRWGCWVGHEEHLADGGTAGAEAGRERRQS